MSSKCYPEEFRTEAAKQVMDRGYSVADITKRFDVTTNSLYAWIKRFGPDSEEYITRKHNLKNSGAYFTEIG